MVLHSSLTFYPSNQASSVLLAAADGSQPWRLRIPDIGSAQPAHEGCVERCSPAGARILSGPRAACLLARCGCLCSQLCRSNGHSENNLAKINNPQQQVAHPGNWLILLLFCTTGDTRCVPDTSTYVRIMRHVFIPDISCSGVLANNILSWLMHVACMPGRLTFCI
jgi:hypothetical protein